MCVSKGKFVVLLRLIFKTFSSKRKRRDDQQGRLHLKLRKTGEGNWQTSEGLWAADETVMDRMIDPRNDMPEFDAAFLKLIRPSKEERGKIFLIIFPPHLQHHYLKMTASDLSGRLREAVKKTQTQTQTSDTLYEKN